MLGVSEDPRETGVHKTDLYDWFDCTLPTAMQTKPLIEPAPLYPRLPRGPHRLDRRAVLRNQRARLLGAMIEATAAAGGYEGTSVQQVTALAGVSRRAFYEQFENRERCLIAAFDAVAARALARSRAAYLAARAPRERRLRAALAALAEDAAGNPSAAALATVEIEACGPAGIAHLRRAGAAFEAHLAMALSSEPASVPRPILRGVLGGLHGILAARLAGATAPSAPDLSRELQGWTSAFGAGPTRAQAAAMARTAATLLQPGLPAGGGARQHQRRANGSPSAGGERLALQAAVLRLAAVGEFGELTPARIGDEAGVPAERIHALFADRHDCLAAAMRDLGAALLARVESSRTCAEDWPSAARAAVGALLAHLAEHPLCAHTIARGAFAGGAPAVGENRALARAVAGLLLQGASPSSPAATVDGVAGGLWHAIGCQVAGGRTQLLPALRDHLAFIVIAPVLGGEHAAAVLSGACG